MLNFMLAYTHTIDETVGIAQLRWYEYCSLK